MNSFTGNVRRVILSAATAILFLGGCYSSPQAEYRNPRRPVAVAVIGEDDYVYYPGYETYYNSRRHQYVYRENNVWVYRSEAPRVWARELRSAPSVHVDFHDAPEHHHVDIVRTYPKTWRPQPNRSDRSDGRPGNSDRRDNDGHDGRDDRHEDRR